MKKFSYLLPLLACITLAMLAGCNGKKNGGGTPKPAPKPKQTTLDRIKAAGVLRIAIRSESPPFSFKDDKGNPRGFEVDMGFALAKRMGVRPDFIFVSVQDRMTQLQAGNVDCVMATLTATRSRCKEIDFSIPYFEDQQRLMVKKDSSIQSYRDLDGKKIAAMEPSTNFKNLTVVSPDCTPVGVQDMQAALKLLEEGQVDAITWDGVKLAALAHEKGAAYRLAGEGFSIEPYCVGLPRNDSEFRYVVNDFLMDFWTSGQWAKSFHRWLGETPDVNPTFQMPVLPD